MACFCHALDAAPMPFPEPGVRPHYPPSRAVRIVHAAVDLTVDPVARTFSGVARLRIEPYPGYAGRFAFDLDEVDVVSVRDGAGAELAWELGDGALTVRAERAPAEVVVTWSGRDPRHGLYFTGPEPYDLDRAHTAWTQCQDEDAHFVFPCHDHPAVKHGWTLTLRAPAGYELLSNGAPGESGADASGVWATFEQAEPMPAYLVTFVAAPLVRVEDRAGSLPVRYWVPPRDVNSARRVFGRTPAMIEHFAALIGVPYPWPRYDQVVVHEFVFGGMENVACTTMTDLILADEKAELEAENDSLVAHELAHQWFGDLVTCQDWSQGWLNESWATLMEAVWWEHAHPGADAVWYRWNTAQGYHAEHSGRYARPIVSYEFREPIDLFDRHLYNKGSCVLWTLRAELGPAAFWAGVRTYLERHRHQTVHTRHFQRALEDASGVNLEGFFAQWVHAPGHPVVSVELGRDGDRQVTVTVEQKQAGAGVPEVFRFDLHLQVVFDDGTARDVTLGVDARQRVFVIPTDRAVRTVRVDPGYQVLAELTLSGVEGWLVALAADPCPVLALRAARALLRKGTPRGFDAVASAQREHPHFGLRGALAGELAQTRRPAVVGALAAALAAETDPRAKRQIAAALGGFRVPEAADALLALLATELPTWQLEGTALVALGQTRDPRARPALEARLTQASWADLIRQRALEGLAETEDPGVLDLLLAHTRPELTGRTRAAAATALGRLSDAVESVRRAGVERLAELVDGSGFRTQIAAIAALARVRDPGGEAALARAHTTAPDGRTRRNAYEALVQVRRGRNGEQAVAGLTRRLDGLVDDHAKLRERLDRLER
ncbi:MAG: M1 family aminopeptidase [Myxococcota bacterium]